MISAKVLLFAVSFAVGCASISGLANSLPAAETPILETILDTDHHVLAAYHGSGVFEVQPGRALELRLRAVWPTALQVRIEGQLLVEVKDSSGHTELDASGYFRIVDTRPIHASDPRYFTRILMVLPSDKRGAVNFTLTLHDISLDKNSSGAAREAPPLAVTVFRTPISVPKPSAVFFTGPDAKHLKSGADAAFIADNVTLAGWLVATPSEQNDDGTEKDDRIEDIHYSLWLDPDFIDRNYQNVVEPLSGAIMPGMWFTQFDDLARPKVKIPLTGGKPPNVGTFLLPGTGDFTVELNAWHMSKHGGQSPTGWVSDPLPAVRPDVTWPFHPMRPPGIAASEPPLGEGDYVIVSGALVEDSMHHPDVQDPKPEGRSRTCWHEHYHGHGGWLEIHPLDGLRRVRAPAVRKYPQVIQICDGKGRLSLYPFDPIPALGWDAADRVNLLMTPIPSDPPTANSALRYLEIVDERLSDLSKLEEHVVELDHYDPAKLHVALRLRLAASGTFKAVYVMWWEETSTPRPPKTAHPDPIPAELPMCSKKPYLPQCDNPTRD